ncbi:terminase small subunit [Lentilactobacillus sp. SPB1-3]|uniref:Terminase small subunit n=1 Tax=Lentilactobacillus terminaliae TaxID=3003483 RepID=A0ACD5DE80_9LACO|nr:terminase small subunit [Lentilactobacillus sp. SPB1-3]MCZ0978028.1 terminase small subunit [Lentilactobacillus sp. SPB1-3]
MDWDKVRAEYEVTDITLSDLAKKYDIKPGTLRSRKNRDKWQRGTSNELKSNDVATQRNTVATQNAVAQLHDSDLNDKQKLFCLYYLQRFNATWAYQKAYDVKRKAAEALGSKMLRNVKVREEIESLKKQQQQDLFLDANDILKEYVKQAFTSLDQVINYKSVEVPMIDQEGDVAVDVHGKPMTKHLTDVYLNPSDEIDWSVIQDIHVGRDGLVVKSYDKQKAMKELLERLPEPTNENEANDGFIQAIKEAAKQLEGDKDK